MFPSSSLHRITWGVEAFPEGSALQNKTARILEALAGSMGMQIEPVYVMTPDQLRLPPQIFMDIETYGIGEDVETPRSFAERSREISELVTGHLKNWINQLGGTHFLPPHILVQHQYSSRVSVETLVAYAKNTGAEWIAVSTHARHGLTRVLLGSFAESLVSHSELPVLIVGPETVPVESIRRVWFPTDLSVTSRSAFDYAIEMARLWNAELTVYHKVPHLLEYTSTFQQDAPDLEMRMRYGELKRVEVDAWAADAGERGVRADAILDDDSGDLAESILLRASQLGPAMVVMESKSGPLSSMLLGSVTRTVIRSSRCPVLVLHPAREEVRQAV